MNILHSKKFKHGSISLALTVTIIAAVILVNAIFTALAEKNLWYIDMTSEDIYSLTDAAKDLIIESAYDPIYGARPLKRFLQSRVETLIARKMIAEDIAPETTVTVDAENGILTATASK